MLKGTIWNLPICLHHGRPILPKTGEESPYKIQAVEGHNMMEKLWNRVRLLASEHLESWIHCICCRYVSGKANTCHISFMFSVLKYPDSSSLRTCTQCMVLIHVFLIIFMCVIHCSLIIEMHHCCQCADLLSKLIQG